MDDYDSYLLSQGLDPSYFGGGAGPAPATPASPSSSGTSSFLSSLFSAGGNVLTQALKNQALGSQTNAQAKLAAANAASSSSTLKIVIIAVVGLVGIGLVFAFLKKRGR